mmetsp:Transcript_118884/g.296572  ORF Transcript_118884/g.296572 Transcript_118884/m.296572 type:complete len:417 (+) Transcript_118884:77-1327(+)|eukprot:CAMPEP_0115249216 /NCGR_PEP_ID=MMETSP0270-20121206/42476_1 /TAXON_ID=71861 /ORGANISM="Scrippsiella trochoidea, Strain CCMP3099" /LENGTH=416 /DNA_ID=CAMNT_0002664551 /DNA_START=71 /DNA_END=1321 /DNA_ORIENTATION=+
MWSQLLPINAGGRAGADDNIDDADLLEASPKRSDKASVRSVMHGGVDADFSQCSEASRLRKAQRGLVLALTSILGLVLACRLVVGTSSLASPASTGAGADQEVVGFAKGGNTESQDVCAKPYLDDCRNMTCCGEFTTCYEKSDEWAACKPTCTLGAPEEAPPWDPGATLVPWTCKVLGKKQAVPTWEPSDASPSLYCFLVTLVHGYEPELLRYQLAKGIGIFGCNAYSVFSERQMLLGPSPNGSIVRTTAISGPMSSCVNNTYDFLRAWHKVAAAGEFRKHSWSIKVDPDTVFLPSRLRPKLQAHHIATDVQKLYFRNCATYKSVQGPLELFSSAAAEAFFGSLQFCRSQSYIMKHGEDWFFGHCMEALGVKGVEDYNLLDDQWCTGKHPQCSADMAAYHPFKTVDRYIRCVEDAS